MAAESSSQGSHSSSKTRGRRRTCFCGEKPVLRTSSTTENSRRIFWGCVNYQIGEQCEYFAWAEAEGQDLQDPQIQRLKRKTNVLKNNLHKFERKFAVAVAIGIFGWVIVRLLLYERHIYVRHMKLSYM